VLVTEVPRAALRRQSGSEAVYEVLRAQIIAGELAPCERLAEVDVAGSLGVSRTPVREALRLLLGEQLVERRPTGGFRVSPLDIADVKGVYEVRALLEGLLARDACERLTEDHLATLRQQIERMRLLRDHDSEVVKIGREFHGLIEGVAGNRWARQLLQQIRGHVDRYRTVSTRAAGRPAEAAAEHQVIYDALVARDPERADAAMRDHVHRSGESALRSLTDP
jgi:DNA-binding GntR family transcriptional regulator